MCHKKMLRIQTDPTDRFEIQNPSVNLNDNVQTVIETDVVPTLTTTKDFELYCPIPGCITNTDEEEVENISFFAPPIECVNEWSSVLGLQLTVNCFVCERHFRPQDFICPELLVNGLYKVVKSLVPFALPIPINAVRSGSNARNNVPKKSSNCSNTFMSMDDFLTIESSLLQKLENISAINSLSISLEPIENNNIIEPSAVDLFSKTPDKSSMTITLEPRLKNELSSTTNNNTPYISHPSTSSCSVYNMEAISQQSSLQYEQEATSMLKLQEKLSNTVICPEFINNQKPFLKPIPLTNKSNSSELSEIKSSSITKCISPEVKSDTCDSNSYYRTYQRKIIDDDISEEFKKQDNGFIFEISKTVKLPSLLWNSSHRGVDNATAFCYRLFFKETVKKICFYNSLVPFVHVYGKKYKHHKPITSKIELENLLEEIDNIEKCFGRFGFVNKKCIGFFEGSSEDIQMCSACQGWITDQDLQKMKKKIESKSKNIKCLKNKIAKRKAVVLKLRDKMKKEKKMPSGP